MSGLQSLENLAKEEEGSLILLTLENGVTILGHFRRLNRYSHAVLTQFSGAVQDIVDIGYELDLGTGYFHANHPPERVIGYNRLCKID